MYRYTHSRDCLYKVKKWLCYLWDIKQWLHANQKHMVSRGIWKLHLHCIYTGIYYVQCLYLHVLVTGVWCQGLSLGPILIDNNLLVTWSWWKSLEIILLIFIYVDFLGSFRFQFYKFAKTSIDISRLTVFQFFDRDNCHTRWFMIQVVQEMS